MNAANKSKNYLIVQMPIEKIGNNFIIVKWLTVIWCVEKKAL